MKILVFGAGSKTGVHLVRKATAEGHEVTAFLRKPNAEYPDSGPVITFLGDALTKKDVEAVIPGHDVVYVLLGPNKKSPPNMTERSTRFIIDAMQTSGVKRLIVTSVTGIGTEPSTFRGFNRFMIGLFQLLGKSLMSDRNAQFTITAKCDLDWTLCRLPNLHDKEPTGSSRIIPEPGILYPGMSRSDAADALFSVLDDRSSIHQAPIFTSP